jgi:HSP20 family protein
MSAQTHASKPAQAQPQQRPRESSERRASALESTGTPVDMAMKFVPQPWRDIISAPLSAWPFAFNYRQMLPLYAMRHEMMHIADQMTCSLFQAQDSAQAMLKGVNSATMRSDVKENEYCFQVKLPGVSAEEVEVSIVPGSLIIAADHAQRRSETAKGVSGRFEERQHFERIFPLPWDADIARAEAEFADGALQVVVPRVMTPQAEPRSLSIRSRRHLSHNDNAAQNASQQERKAS